MAPPNRLTFLALLVWLIGCDRATEERERQSPNDATPLQEAEATVSGAFTPITAPNEYGSYTNDSIHFNPLGCPVEWPQRVQQVLDSAQIRPVEERCQSVVADFDDNGRDDIVITADSPSGRGYVVVLDADPPRAEWLAPLGEVIWAVPAGDHSLEGCFDDLEDSQLLLPRPGFWISSGYYHLEDGAWIIHPSSGC